MRVKEDAQDYRYFPDPDILPVIVTDEQLTAMKKSLPELPLQRAARFVKDLQLSTSDAALLTEERELSDYFEACGKACGNYKAAANWIISELLRELNESKLSVHNSKISAQNFADLIKQIDQGTISGKIAKVVFKEMWDTGGTAADIIKAKGLVQVSDVGEIEKIVSEVVAANPSQVAEFKAGKDKVIGFFVGAIMKASKGKANPAIVNEILMKKLSE